jgi:hypothetical protein
MEDETPYDAGRSAQRSAPRTAPAAQPTEQQLVDYFLNSLSVARQVPGGMGYVWSHLKLHLSPDQIKRLAE